MPDVFLYDTRIEDLEGMLLIVLSHDGRVYEMADFTGYIAFKDNSVWQTTGCDQGDIIEGSKERL